MGWKCMIHQLAVGSNSGLWQNPALVKAMWTFYFLQIYATEATTRLGQLMMEDIIARHMKFRQLYGLEESGLPKWMKWEELELLPSALKEIVLGNKVLQLHKQKLII